MGDYAMMKNRYGDNWESNLMDEINADYAKENQNQAAYEDYIYEKEGKEKRKEIANMAYFHAKGSVRSIARNSAMLYKECPGKVDEKILPELIAEYIEDVFRMGYFRASKSEDSIEKIIDVVLYMSAFNSFYIWNEIMSDGEVDDREHERISEIICEMIEQYLIPIKVVSSNMHDLNDAGYPQF